MIRETLLHLVCPRGSRRVHIPLLDQYNNDYLLTIIDLADNLTRGIIKKSQELIQRIIDDIVKCKDMYFDAMLRKFKDSDALKVGGFFIVSGILRTHEMYNLYFNNNVLDRIFEVDGRIGKYPKISPDGIKEKLTAVMDDERFDKISHREAMQMIRDQIDRNNKVDRYSVDLFNHFETVYTQIFAKSMQECQEKYNRLMNKLSQHKDSVGLLVDPIPLATPLSQVVTSDQTVQGLREEIRRLQQTIHELESRAPPLPTPSLSVSSVDSQTMALENSREECKDLTHRLQGAEEEGKRLAMGMDALRADRDRLETECQSLKHTLSKQSKSIKTANSQRDSLQLRLDGINKDIGQWKEEILGMKTIIEEKNEEIARLNEEIERVHSQMKRLEAENTSLLKEKERLLDNLDNEVKRVMEDRLDDVRVEYEAKISDMATRSHIEETKLSKEIKSLKEEIRQNEDYYSNLMHKLQVNSKRERANEIRNGDKVREACKLHSDNFKTEMMPWQFINTTAMCALTGHNNRYVLGYEEDQHYKIGIFDGENLEDFDKGYSCVLREQLPGPVLDVCALGKDKYAAIFSGENSSGTLLIGLGDSVSSVPVKFKSDYMSGRKSSNPTSNSKILHWYNNCIYFLESSQRVAKLTEKLTKWTTEYLASSQKTLQEMTIADGVIYMISKTHLSRMEVSTGMEKTKDVCDSDFVLSILHVSGDLVFCAASCFDKATRPKDQLVSVRIFVYTTDLVPISDILSEDFSDHVRYLHLVRGAGKNSTLIAIEGSDRPKIRFFSLDTKHSLTLVVNNDNIYKGIVNGMLMLDDRIVLYGQKRLSRIDNENLPNFRYLKFI